MISVVYKDSYRHTGEGYVLKPSGFLKTVLVRACLIDALLFNTVYLAAALVDARFVPVPSVVAWMIVQSLYLSLSFCFLFSDLLVPSLRLLIHYLVTGLVFWLTCVLPGGYLKIGTPSGISFLVCFVVYTCIYAIIGAVIVLIRRLSAAGSGKKKTYGSMFGRPEETEYKSQFSSDSGDRRKKGKG